MYHFCLSQHYEVVYLHTLREVDSFNTQFGTQCSSYMCQIFEVIAKKLWLFFADTVYFDNFGIQTAEWIFNRTTTELSPLPYKTQHIFPVHNHSDVSSKVMTS